MDHEFFLFRGAFDFYGVKKHILVVYYWGFWNFVNADLAPEPNDYVFYF